jgi:hypothetical protein
MDPQRLVQRTVERGAVAPELSPELLLPPGVSKRKGEDHVWFKDRWMVASLCDE